MASCCWFDDFIATVQDPVSWADGVNQWCDLLRSTEVPPFDAYFSGVPSYLRGDIGLLGWRVYSDALSQFARGWARWSHMGLADGVRYARSRIVQRTGGIHPVCVFVVPDGYMRNYTPTWRNKFQFQSAWDYTGDLDVTIPSQAKQTPYYLDFAQARSLGFPQWPDADMKPESTSELDIDINLAFVNFRDLDYAGYSIEHFNVLLSNHGHGMDTSFVVKIPRRKTNISGVVTPVVFVDYTTWISGTSANSKQELISGYAHSAGPAPVSGESATPSDTSIIEGLNRIYPLSTESPEIALRLPTGVLDWVDSDWEDNLAAQTLTDLFTMLPVQEWSPPNMMQGETNDSTDPE